MTRWIDDLRYASEVLHTQRFAGLDQNPSGIRDLIGSAVYSAEQHDITARQLLAALMSAREMSISGNHVPTKWADIEAAIRLAKTAGIGEDKS